MSDETWKPIPGLQGYEASSLGRIRSIDRTTVTAKSDRAQSFRCRRQGQLFVLRMGTAGYLRVSIQHRTYLVHRLVAAAFIGRCPGGEEVHHIDHVKTNNTDGNLLYVSHRRNLELAIAEGRWPDSRGENSGHAILTTTKVRQARERCREGESSSSIAADFGVAPRTIRDAVRGRTWSHIAR